MNLFSDVNLAKGFKCLLPVLPLHPNHVKKRLTLGRRNSEQTERKKTMVKLRKMIFYASNSSEYKVLVTVSFKEKIQG